MKPQNNSSFRNSLKTGSTDWVKEYSLSSDTFSRTTLWRFNMRHSRLLVLSATAILTACSGEKAYFSGETKGLSANRGVSAEALPTVTPTPLAPPSTSVVENNKCRPGHLLYKGSIFYKVPGSTYDYWTQTYKIVVGPTKDLYDMANKMKMPGSSIENGASSAIWQPHMTFAVCTSAPLPKCPSDWIEKKIQECTLESVPDGYDKQLFPAADFEKICPEKHRLYGQMCKANNVTGPNYDIAVEMFGPVADVCVNACNYGGCQHVPVGQPAVSICVEDELPLCKVFKYGICRVE